MIPRNLRACAIRAHWTSVVRPSLVPRGDPSGVFGLIRIADSPYDAEVCGWLAFIGKVADIADNGQPNAGAESADLFDPGRFLPFQLPAFLGDRLLQFGNPLVQAADLDFNPLTYRRGYKKCRRCACVSERAELDFPPWISLLPNRYAIALRARLFS